MEQPKGFSLLDQDFYTFTVGAVVASLYPVLPVRYEFKCRNEGVIFDEPFAESFQKKLDVAAGKKFTHDQIEYLAGLGAFSDLYLRQLSKFEYDPEQYVQWVVKDGKLRLAINAMMQDGIHYEVPTLAAVNEAYFENTSEEDMKEAIKILNAKIQLIKDYNQRTGRFPKFVEFGTRRRFSESWHRFVFEKLRRELPNNVIGTSNVKLSRLHNLTPIGTQSHQYYQMFQALGNLEDSLKNALDTWIFFHRGKYATLLTDILGSEAFYSRMEAHHWKCADAFRGDSGDNQWWIDLTIDSIRNKGHLDPKTKTLALSNGLDVPECLELDERNWDRVKEFIWCIGTKFTNHFPRPALNIVIKLTQVTGKPVAKLSDDIGKGMCTDDQFLWRLKEMFQLK